MVKEIIVLRDSGIPLFHYSVSGEQKLDVLVAGFLSALGFFAEQVGETKIRVMSFAKSKFVWEQKGDLYFIALVAEEDSSEIYRVVLQNIGEQFVSTYYSELRDEHPDPKAFRPFIDTVEITLQKFDGIPGLARRYKTALIPVEQLRILKEAAAAIEKKKSVNRAALITNDGYILASNFRAYELEAILDILVTFGSDENIQKESMLAVHTSLDPSTQYFLLRIEGTGIGAFVVDVGKALTEYAELVKDFVKTASNCDYSEMRKIAPDRGNGAIDFYDYDIVELAKPRAEILEELRALFVGIPQDMQENIETVLRIIKKNSTIDEIEQNVGLPKEVTSEVLAYLISREVAEVSKVFPIMEDKDERFAAYLEVVGMPKKDYVVVDTIWKFCNGSYSVKEISEKTKIAPQRIIEVMRALGKYVKWERDRVLKKVR